MYCRKKIQKTKKHKLLIMQKHLYEGFVWFAKPTHTHTDTHKRSSKKGAEQKGSLTSIL